MARGKERRDTKPLQLAPGPRRPFFLGHEPQALSHEPSGMHQASSMRALRLNGYDTAIWLVGGRWQVLFGPHYFTLVQDEQNRVGIYYVRT